MNDKIDARYLQRLAAVYVRQSSPTQVRNNQESLSLIHIYPVAAGTARPPPDRTT